MQILQVASQERTVEKMADRVGQVNDGDNFHNNCRIKVAPLFYDHHQNHVGVVIKEGWSSTRDFTIFITFATRNTRIDLHTAMHNSIVHTENGFRGVPVAVADCGKHSDQSTTMSSRRLTQNSVRWPRFQQQYAFFLE